ncbi:hypothetical protein AC578_7633 [Pseudocercospora eumusae]|uniref:Uncharacterized protein n=1 Tax=Pseudocercospora eumusae TaxID=321146 RepID=A0A139H643_9PEZI|nr:hypothetical protein AC578_7633 [Pseudocercospora eumusae]
MLPLSALLMAGAWFAPLDFFNSVATGYAASPLTWKDAAFPAARVAVAAATGASPLTWLDAAFSAARVAAAVATAAYSEEEQPAPKWQGLGYCGYHGVILLPPSAKVREGVPLGCDEQTEYTSSDHDNQERFDSRNERATEDSESIAPWAFGLARVGLAVFGSGGRHLLSAAGFDKVGVRAGSLAADYQAAKYGGATPSGGVFAWAQSCAMKSCAG